MNINVNNSPSFGARFLNNIKIGKLFEQKQYGPSWVSFVELDPNLKSDMNALEKVAKYWDNDKFAQNIYYDAVTLKNKPNNMFYAITSQYGCFHNLEYNKILGLMHVRKLADGKAFIEHIQVLPDMIYNSVPLFKGIGTGMLTSLKKLYNCISCVPVSDKSVKDFYVKNGFYTVTNGMQYHK